MERFREKRDVILDWIQMGFLLLLSPFFLFPTKNLVWILFFFPCFLILKWIVSKHIIERTIVDWGIWLLLIQVLVTCFIVPDLWFSMPKITGLIFGVAFFFTAVNLLKSESFIKIGTIVFLLLGLILCVAGVMGMGAIPKNDTYFDKTAQKLANLIPKIDWNLSGAEKGFNPNVLAGTLILVIPSAIALFVLYLRKKQSMRQVRWRIHVLICLIIVLFIMCGVLFVTSSIGSWIALYMSIWLIFASWKWKKLSLAVFMLFIGFIILFKPAGILTTWEIVKKDITETKIGKRENLWRAGLKAIEEHPLSGVGMNRIRQIPPMKYEQSHVHNHLIQTAAEVGIPGLIAYLAILMGTGWCCWVVWKKGKISWMRYSVLGLGAGQLAHFIWGIGDSIPLGAKPGLFFWISLALIAAIYNYEKRHEISLSIA